MERYSPVYQTERRQYRYNYTRGRLEQIGKRIVVRSVRGRRVPIVEQQVISYTVLKPEAFDRVPGYWVELFDSAIDRDV